MNRRTFITASPQPPSASAPIPFSLPAPRKGTDGHLEIFRPDKAARHSISIQFETGANRIAEPAVAFHALTRNTRFTRRSGTDLA